MREITKKRDFKKCKACGKKSRYISRRGLCETCATLACKKAAIELKMKQGNVYDKWLKKIKSSIQNL